MMDIANLGFRIDTGDISRARSEVNALSGAAKSLAGVLGAAFTFQKTVQSITAFEDSMLKLRATSRATEADMAKLEKQARSLGATTRYSAKQAADAQNFLAMAGFSTGEILQSTGDVIKFASAASIDLAQSADIASNVLGQMGLGVESLGMVMDTMINSSQSGNTTVTQMAEALSYVGPIAAASGVGINELSASIAVLGDAGVQGSRGGTALTRVISKLSNVTPAAEAALLKYGIKLKDVDISSVGLTSAMEVLGGASLSVGDAFTILGEGGFSAAQILAKGADNTRALSKANEEAAGTTAEVASILDSGLSAALASVTSALEEAMLQTGDAGLTGAMKLLAVTVAGVISSFNGLLPEFAEANGLSERFTRNIELLSEAVKAAVILFGAKLVGAFAGSAIAMAASAVQAARLSIAVLSLGGASTSAAVGLVVLQRAAMAATAAMAALGGPIGIAVIAASALYLFATRSDEAKKETKELDTEIKLLTGSFLALSKQQAASALLDYEAKLKQVTEQIKITSESIPLMKAAMELNISAEWVERYREKIIRAEGSLSDMQGEADDLGRSITTLKGVMNGSVQTVAGVSEAFRSMTLDILEQTLAIENNTAASLFDARVKAGLMPELLEGEAEALRLQYEKLDALKVSRKASDDAANSARNAANAALEDAERQLQAIADTVAALELQASQVGMTSSAIAIMNLRTAGATAQQVALASAALSTVDAFEKQAAINTEFGSIVDSLMTEEEAIQESYNRRREIILEATEVTELERTDAMLRLEQERSDALGDINATYWESYLSAAESSLSNFDNLAQAAVNSFSSGFGSAFESMIFDSNSLGEAMQNLAQGMARAVVNALGQMAAQWLVYQAVQALTKTKDVATSAAAAAANTATAVASGAAITAAYTPAAIAATIATLGGAAVAGSAAMATSVPVMAATIASSSIAGMAHDGIDSVPQTGTWLLEKGERVTTSETSAKLDATLDQIRNQGGGSATVNVNLYEDASKAGTVEQQDNEDGSTDINVFVSDIMSGGDRAQVLQSVFGLQRQGS